eukprot:TRINITY_DN929_c2_g2_i1.p1 TRINITY_DN929_c2_g2~~TRINITY_DN929_c2_g2_i1.p1  ORF type:complete len:929 (-),score=337.46 TRINITY_DN929_c2_g2_i1:86-2872(-)
MQFEDEEDISEFLRPDETKLQIFEVYQAKAFFLIVGSNSAKTCFEILKIYREIDELKIVRENYVHDAYSIEDLLLTLKNTNQLSLVCIAHGILGFVKFSMGYYLVMITKSKVVGLIGLHEIRNIVETQQIYLPVTENQPAPSGAETSKENRYKALFNGLDVTNFYFSYSYDLTRTLQYNFFSFSRKIENFEENNKLNYDDRFSWNQYLLEPLIKEQLWDWILPTFHGYFQQNKCTGPTGQIFYICLIARRTRHFAGTRYLKRGVNEQGHVANDVETEQIIFHLPMGNSFKPCLGAHLSSYVQIRGSIPLYWGQEPRVLSPKPPITVQRHDPYYTATIRHFSDLYRRFGEPVWVLNLVKAKEKVERENILRVAFQESVNQINEWISTNQKIVYEEFDFHQEAKSKKSDVLEKMSKLVIKSLRQIGFFHCGKKLHSHSIIENYNLRRQWKEIDKNSEFEMCQYATSYASIGGTICKQANSVNEFQVRAQSGVLRSNCIDSLDRTNAAQFVAAKVIFGYQLFCMGITEQPQLDYDNNYVQSLMDLYQEMGNHLALQYGGSLLAHTVETYRKQTVANQSRDFFTTVKRFYSNSFIDAEKQHSINLFLGNFVPYQESVNLWELDTDNYLHYKLDAVISADLLCNTQWWLNPLSVYQSDLVIGSLKKKNSKINQKREELKQLVPRGRTENFIYFDFALNQFKSISTTKSTVEQNSADTEETVAFNAIYGIKRWFSAEDKHKTNKLSNNDSQNNIKNKTEHETLEQFAEKRLNISLQCNSKDTNIYERYCDLNLNVKQPTVIKNLNSNANLLKNSYSNSPATSNSNLLNLKTNTLSGSRLSTTNVVLNSNLNNNNNNNNSPTTLSNKRETELKNYYESLFEKLSTQEILTSTPSSYAIPTFALYNGKKTLEEDVNRLKISEADNQLYLKWVKDFS